VAPGVVARLGANLRELTISHVKSRNISRAELEMFDRVYQLAIGTINGLDENDVFKELRGDWLVFPGNDNRNNFLKDADYRAVFDKAAARIGVKGLTPHELRHTCASLSIQAGANVKAVQRLLGHATATMTLDLYGHLFDDDLVAVADALDKAMRNCGITAVSNRDS
jgi:integrase